MRSVRPHDGRDAHRKLFICTRAKSEIWRYRTKYLLFPIFAWSSKTRKKIIETDAFEASDFFSLAKKTDGSPRRYLKEALSAKEIILLIIHIFFLLIQKVMKNWLILGYNNN